MPDKLSNFSATPANNNSAPPDGAPEGMTPSNVNNVIRENMSRVREWYEDAEWIDLGLTVDSYTSTTVTVTGDQSAHFADDQVIRLDSTNLAIVTNVSVATDTTITVAGYTLVAQPTVVEKPIVTDSLACIGFGTGSVKVDGSGNVAIAGASTVAITGTTTIGGNAVLTTANEGAGNGLDADTLDGQEGSYYLAAANITGTIDADTVGGQTPTQLGSPSGTVLMFAGATEPTGYLFCDGAEISRTTYSDLFAAIGTTYGVGDGSSTFNIPDMRGEFVRGHDDGRGIDSGRALGTFQDWATLYTDRYEMGTGVNGSGLKFVPTDGTAGDWVTSGRNDGGSRSMRFYTNGEDDNRPRNIALNFIIKT